MLMEDAKTVKSIVGDYLVRSGSKIAKKFMKDHNVKPLRKGAPPLEVLVKENYIHNVLVQSANKIFKKK